MQKTLFTLFESLNCGFIWVDRDSRVRYINAQASSLTALQPQAAVPHGPLRRAIDAVLAGRTALPLALPTASGDGRTLKLRVMQGLGRDDAAVFVSVDADMAPAVGLDNLLTVIRTDLSEPWKRCSVALGLARQSPDRHALEALFDEVEEVGGVLSKLIDLAQIWSSESLLSNDRIDMWDLVREVWKNVEALARSRSVQVRFTRFPRDVQLSTVYGSHAWLLRVFIECLEAAIRATPAGGTVDIEYHQMGPRVLVVFRDCGLFAPRRLHADRLDDLTSAGSRTGEAPRLSARDLIGLRLCQRIVELHGGQLREEMEDGLRNFLIDLPTGAPARNATPEMDIQQAQQYARDLAALMARRRAELPPTGPLTNA